MYIPIRHRLNVLLYAFIIICRINRAGHTIYCKLRCVSVYGVCATSTGWSLNLHKIVIRTDYATYYPTSSRLRAPKLSLYHIIYYLYTYLCSPLRPRNRVLNNNNNNNPIQSVGRDNANSNFKYDIYMGRATCALRKFISGHICTYNNIPNNIRSREIDDWTKNYGFLLSPLPSKTVVRSISKRQV